jgi:hypothetical protein
LREVFGFAHIESLQNTLFKNNSLDCIRFWVFTYTFKETVRCPSYITKFRSIAERTSSQNFVISGNQLPYSWLTPYAISNYSMTCTNTTGLYKIKVIPKTVLIELLCCRVHTSMFLIRIYVLVFHLILGLPHGRFPRGSSIISACLSYFSRPSYMPIQS